MSKGGKGSSQSENHTNTTVDNNQVGASEGALAIGANSSGNTVNISSSDADTVHAASDAITRAASDAITAGTEASKAGLNFGDHALVFADDIGSKAIQSNNDTSLASIQAASNTTQEANDLLSRSQELFTNKLSDNAGVAPQTLLGDSMKYIVIGVVVLAGVYLLSRKGTN